MADGDVIVQRPKVAARNLNPAGGDTDAAPVRRYTFSVVEEDPQSPKTPALPKAGAGFTSNGGDPVVSVPAMIDNSVITIQNRMEAVQAVLRKDAECLDPDLHRMEFDMMNSVYRTVQNVAYHVNKINRQLNPREEKWSRPVDGQDGMDLVSGMRNAMTSCQRGGTTMGKLVKDRKKMLNSDSTAQVVGQNGIVMLGRIEGAMSYALVKSGRVVEALDAMMKRRERKLLQIGASAFMSVQASQGDTKMALDLAFKAWIEAVAICKAERAEEAAMAEEAAEAPVHEGQVVDDDG